jgi:hypothetical protein
VPACANKRLSSKMEMNLLLFLDGNGILWIHSHLGLYELILHLSGSGASKITVLHFLRSSAGGFILFMIPMRPWFVAECPVNFRARIDQFIGD